MGKENGHDVDEWPGRTEEMLAAIPGALDPGTRLMVDANCGYSPAKAIELGRRLEQNGFVHFEEPCSYWEYEQTAEVRAALDGSAVEVAGGEQDWDLATWRRLFDQHVFDVVQPDLLYLGGLAATSRVATLAQSAHIPVLMHSANLALGIMFTLHLVSALGGELVEWSIEGPDYYPWQHCLYEPMPEVVDGRVTAPVGPGWGVEINDNWLGAAERRVSEE